MNAIDRIASVFSEDCNKALSVLIKIQHILDTSKTDAHAIKLLEHRGYIQYVDEDDLGLVAHRIGRYTRCMEAMADIKTLARKVSVVCFCEADSFNIFNHEVSFSYACKLLSSVGPSLGHFSNNPTRAAVVGLELKLACEAPLLQLESYSDLLCMETMLVPDSPSCARNTVRNCILDDLRRNAKRIRLITVPAKRESVGAGSGRSLDQESCLICKEEMPR